MAFVCAGLLALATSLNNQSHTLLDQQPTVGRLIEFSGQVSIKRGSKIVTTKDSMDLHHLDQLSTGDSASMVILLTTSDYEIQIFKNSIVILELWSDSQKNSPLYLNFISGSYKINKKGKAGSLFISMNQKLTRPESCSEVCSAQALVIKAKTIQPDIDPTTAQDRVLIEPESTKKEDSVVEASTKPNIDQPLQSSEIAAVVTKKRRLFGNCQSLSLKSTGKANGKILLGLKINNLGKIHSIETLQSSLPNKEFESCILSVFKRIRFRNFKGQPVSFSYPLVFN